MLVSDLAQFLFLVIFTVCFSLLFVYYLSCKQYGKVFAQVYLSPKLCFANLGTSVTLPRWENFRVSASLHTPAA